MHIKNSKLKFNIIANIFAMLYEMNEINTVITPKIIVIPKKGDANILETKNVSDIELNLSAIIGIITICAENVTESIFAIFLLIFILQKISSMFLLNKIIPIVPKYDN